jgi:hypothetical protein
VSAHGHGPPAELRVDRDAIPFCVQPGLELADGKAALPIPLHRIGKGERARGWLLNGRQLAWRAMAAFLTSLLGASKHRGEFATDHQALSLFIVLLVLLALRRRFVI